MEFISLMKKMSKPAQRAILNSGIATLEELASLSEKDVAQWHGIGPNSLKTLRAILEENGLSFSSSPDHKNNRPKKSA
jgi:DNA-directed RNA polymerase alpha subunit